MAHPEQMQFVRAVSEHLAADYTGTRVLEIGSYDVNGSIRPYFSGSHYVGVDLSEGPGVDLVCGGDEVGHRDDSYDLTVSCECFEHNPRWRETFLNMLRMTRPGGIVMFTCATRGRTEHGTARTTPSMSPGTMSVGWNYYRNLTARDFRRAVAIDERFDGHFFLTNAHSCDLYFVGRKRGGPTLFRFDAPSLSAHCRADIAEFQRARYARSRFPRALLVLARVPLRVASLLPERWFHGFALRYGRLMYGLKSLARRH
jgi:SAM-dependent methyltransferase